MKKIILTITLAVVATVSIAQSRYHVDKIISEKTNYIGEKESNTFFPNEMYVSFVGEYVTVNDESNSIYKQESEMEQEEDYKYKSATWYATDENGSTVLCILLSNRIDGELWFSVCYSDLTIMYRIVNVNN